MPMVFHWTSAYGDRSYSTSSSPINKLCILVFFSPKHKNSHIFELNISNFGSVLTITFVLMRSLKQEQCWTCFWKIINSIFQTDVASTWACMEHRIMSSVKTIVLPLLVGLNIDELVLLSCWRQCLLVDILAFIGWPQQLGWKYLSWPSPAGCGDGGVRTCTPS